MPKAQEINTQPEAQQNLSEETYLAVLEALETYPELIADLIAPLHPADMADLLERLPFDKRDIVTGYIGVDRLPDILAELETGAQEHLLETLPVETVREVVQELESDDAVDVAQTLAAHEEEGSQARDFLTDRHQKRLAQYDPHTAGGLMQLEVLTATPEQTVSDVFKAVRHDNEDLPGDISTVFIINDRRKLLGAIGMVRLVRYPAKTKLVDIMRTEPIAVVPETPESDVANLFEKYDMYSCAVTNKRGQLLGRITIDDVFDAVLARQERQALRAAGVDETEDLFAPTWQTTNKRFPWLLVNLFTAILASMVIALFEDAIQQVVALAILMPIVASMGGNAGTQTLTVTVRGLATNQITVKNALGLLWKEIKVGGFNGLFLAILLSFGALVMYQDSMLALALFLATICNHLLAATAGHLVPYFLKKLKYDPAISSGVLVTTVTDVGGFFIFLGLATMLVL